MTYEHEREIPYKQKVSSYEIKFYDMDNEEIEIELPDYAFASLDDAIYEWELETDVID